MNSVKEKVRKAIFSKLRSLRRKLNAQGIPCVYARSELLHEDSDNSFRITYQTTGNNGDMSLLPQLTIRTGEAVEAFDQATFEQGLARVRQLFRGPLQD